MITNYFMLLFGIYLAIFPLFPSAINRTTLFTEFFMVLVIAIYLIMNLSKDRKRKEFIQNLGEFFRDKASLVSTVLLVYMIISISYSQSLVLALRDSMRFGIALSIFFIVRFEIKNEKQLMGLIRFVYVPAFFEFCYSIYQHFTGFGLKHTFNAGELIYRIEGTLGHPNTLAGYCILLAFPLFFIIKHEKNIFWKVFYIIDMILSLTTLVLTYSRNIFIALAIGVILICLYYSWKFILGLGIVGAIGVLIPAIRKGIINLAIKLMPSSIVDRIMQFNDKNLNSGRLNIWTLAIKCFKDHPIFGVGIGNYEAVHPQYVEKYPQYNPGETIYHTHNVYLKMLSELGIIGFVLYVLGAILILVKGLKTHLKASGFHKDLVVGILISFVVCYFEVSMFDNLIVLPQLMNYFYLFLGVIYVIDKIDRKYIV